VEVGPAFTIETPGGTVRARIVSETGEGVLDVEVEMGTASFRSADVGLAGPDRETGGEPLELPSGDRVLINTVSIGNPHCVIFQDELDVEDLRRRAPQISTHPDFARGTNVQFAVGTAPDEVEAWVWERGAGETRASGSSACAVAAAAVRRGLVSERQVAVRMPGGTLHVEVRDDWSLVLRGPVEAVCRGELAPGMVARLKALGFG
jgi:diaminopimelate epimerase